MEERSLLWPIFSPQYTCTFVFFIVYCTPFRLAQDPALPSFTHLRLNPDPGRPPALSKPLNKCGTVRALLFHEYRASVCVSHPGLVLHSSKEGNGNDALRDDWYFITRRLPMATLYACREGG